MTDSLPVFSLYGLPVIVASVELPKLETFTLDYKRSLLARLFSGRLHDFIVTEEDQIFLFYMQGRETLIVDPRTWRRLAQALPNLNPLL